LKAIPVFLVAFFMVCASATGAEPLGVAMLSTLGMLVALLLSCFVPWSPGKEARRSDRAVGWIVLVCSVLVYGSVLKTDWPLHLSFRMVRSDLARLASTAKAGQKKTERIEIGPFSVQEVDATSYGGIVCLWTDLDPTGRTGLLYAPNQNVPTYPWSKVRLANDWWLLSED
jgi:hypothetical protein